MSVDISEKAVEERAEFYHGLHDGQGVHVDTAAMLRALRAALTAAEKRADKASRYEDQAVEDRDGFEGQITQIYRALGGEGEWAAKIPPVPPPDSGDLGTDALWLARKIVQDRDYWRTNHGAAYLSRLEAVVRAAMSWMDTDTTNPIADAVFALSASDRARLAAREGAERGSA